MDQEKRFFLGFTDLLTSLFFVMLVLFVLAATLYDRSVEKTLAILEEKKILLQSFDSLDYALGDLDDSVATLRVELESANLENQEFKDSIKTSFDNIVRLDKLNAAISQISEGLFTFNEACQRHEIGTNDIFPPNEYELRYNKRGEVLRAGRGLAQVFEDMEVDDRVRYLLIIEGRSSKFIEGVGEEDEVMVRDYWSFNKSLSFERARSVLQFWEDNGIQFNPERVEVMITGSGFDGQCRYPLEEEEKNKCVIIQVLPKLGGLQP